MNSKLASLRGVCLVTVASSIFAVAPGCSSSNGGGAKMVSSTPLQAPDNTRGIAAAEPSATASANNVRDLEGAQSEDVLNKSTRDVDLGGGGGQQQGQAGALTYEALGAMLKQLGITPEDNKDFYTMKVKATTGDNVNWTFPIDVSLSKDQSLVWISCPLDKIDSNGSPTPDALLNLLQANFMLGNVTFVVDQQKTLIVQQPMDNMGLTAAYLGENLKSFFTSLKQSESLWKAFVKLDGGDNSGGGGGAPKNPFQ